MKKDTEVCFKGRVIRKTYDGGDYKIFAIDVDKDDYPNIKHTKYGNVTILGEINDLTESVEYEIRAVEELSKYGYGYRVINIKRERPTSLSEMYVFLQEILTENQARELYRVYPNIVDKVINNDLDDIDLSKLKGIKEKTFSVIKQKIIENFCLAELVIEFQGLLSFSIINKLYNKYTSIDLLKEKLRENPYKCLCGISGIGFKTADSILLTLEKESKNNIQNGEESIIEFEEDLKTSRGRCLACMLYLLEENENEGHTLMNIVDLRSQCMKMVPACCNYFVDCIQDQSIYFDKKLLTVSLKKTYDTEKYIAYKLILGLLTGSKAKPWNFDIEKYRNVNGCDLSNEQMKVPENMCKYAVSILNGSAGSGKSFSSQAAINMLEDNNKSYVLFAPTGKAAKVIAEYTNRSASTIHRGLGYMPPSEWCVNTENPLNCDVVIIDEFSMTDIFLFKHVLDAIDFKHTKLLLIGDSAQLPSVGCGNVLHDLIESNVIPTVTLTKIFRYGEGGLMKVATDVRMCKPYLSSIENTLTWFGDNKDYAFINVGDSLIVKNSVGLYKKLLNQGYQCEDIAFLTAYKKGEYGSIKINNALQRIANKNYNSNNFMMIGDTKYFVNDLVMQTVNNYHAEIYYDDFCNDNDAEETFIANGESGVIKEIHYGYAIIQFDDVTVKYYRNDMQTISLGYAMTIHKSQGSSAKVVILITPKAHTFMLNSNLIYVGLTRMKEKCFHLGTKSTVDIAVKKKANLVRNTNMRQVIKESILELKNKMEESKSNE